jgi:hypothetical protein
MSCPLCCSLHHNEFAFEEHRKKPIILKEYLALKAIHDERSVMVWTAIPWYSVGPIITHHVRITARKYVDRSENQVHLMIQTLFPTNDSVSQDHDALIDTA